MKKAIIFGIAALIILCSMQKQNKTNYVPDENTAIKIAEAIWLPIYGDSIHQYLPFHAKLINDETWEVYGTITTNKGGTPYIEIQKTDAKVLKVIKTK
jgi:hypothetical protein